MVLLSIIITKTLIMKIYINARKNIYIKLNHTLITLIIIRILMLRINILKKTLEVKNLYFILKNDINF
jgi:hypothetical protein